MDAGRMNRSVPEATFSSTHPLTIGWKERLDFVDWRLHRVKVKIDTGARTSALDAVGFELHEDGLIGPFARLFLSLDVKDPLKIAIVEAPLLRKIVVRNSSGLCEERPLIETTIRLGPIQKRIVMTITSRPGMCFRMLLGRNALANDFLVDVTKKYLLRSHKG
jgi:hypothetical protein